jgi:hypothetical protein
MVMRVQMERTWGGYEMLRYTVNLRADLMNDTSVVTVNISTTCRSSLARQ